MPNKGVSGKRLEIEKDPLNNWEALIPMFPTSIIQKIKKIALTPSCFFELGTLEMLELLKPIKILNKKTQSKYIIDSHFIIFKVCEFIGNKCRWYACFYMLNKKGECTFVDIKPGCFTLYLYKARNFVSPNHFWADCEEGLVLFFGEIVYPEKICSFLYHIYNKRISNQKIAKLAPKNKTQVLLSKKIYKDFNIFKTRIEQVAEKIRKKGDNYPMQMKKNNYRLFNKSAFSDLKSDNLLIQFLIKNNIKPSLVSVLVYLKKNPFFFIELKIKAMAQHKKQKLFKKFAKFLNVFYILFKAFISSMLRFFASVLRFGSSLLLRFDGVESEEPKPRIRFFGEAERFRFASALSLLRFRFAAHRRAERETSSLSFRFDFFAFDEVSRSALRCAAKETEAKKSKRRSEKPKQWSFLFLRLCRSSGAFL